VSAHGLFQAPCAPNPLTHQRRQAHMSSPVLRSEVAHPFIRALHQHSACWRTVRFEKGEPRLLPNGSHVRPGTSSRWLPPLDDSGRDTSPFRRPLPRAAPWSQLAIGDSREFDVADNPPRLATSRIGFWRDAVPTQPSQCSSLVDGLLGRPSPGGLRFRSEWIAGRARPPARAVFGPAVGRSARDGLGADAPRN